jgi:NADH-quinone oxidoreductase subunit E
MKGEVAAALAAAGEVKQLAGMKALTVKSDLSAAGDLDPRPANMLSAPRGGKADDLKLIWGVGDKLERVLNDAGIYHFDQIASWSDKDLAWFDRKFGEAGAKAKSDKWIEQCRKLASGWRPENSSGERPKT